MHGFQLWANLPASLKMTAPRYQDVAAQDIPEVADDDGTRVRVVCGDFWGKKGPVEGVAADPRYLDVSVPPGKRKRLPVETGPPRLCLRVRGLRHVSATRRSRAPCATSSTDDAGRCRALDREAGNRSLVLFDAGDEVVVQAGDEGIRFLLVSGSRSKSRSPGTGRSS